MPLQFDISKIDESDENLPDNSDLEDFIKEEDEELGYWVKGQRRIEHEYCGGIGCIWCNYLGYEIKKTI